jgi:hypothetical protein
VLQKRWQNEKGEVKPAEGKKRGAASILLYGLGFLCLAVSFALLSLSTLTDLSFQWQASAGLEALGYVLSGIGVVMVLIGRLVEK